MSPLFQLLIRALQRLISRCSNSVHAVLYLFRSLWRLLRRRQLSSNEKSGHPTGGPQLDRIRFELPLDDKPSSVSTSIVCASLQPGPELLYNQGDHQSQTSGRPASYNGSLHLSAPYTPNSSRPSLNLGGIPLHDFSSKNQSRISHLSTTSTHPHSRPRSIALGPNPSWRSVHRGVVGKINRSDSPVPAVRVEDPNGNLAASPSPDGTLTSDKRVMFPMAPPWIERYTRGTTRPRDVSEYQVRPLTMTFERGGEPPGWIPFTHPEGALFWYHEEKKILTDAHLYEDDVLNDINIFVEQLFGTLAENNITLERETEIVLELFPSPGQPAECGYYFVNHKARCLFWHEEFNINYLIQEVLGADCPRHIKLEIESQYWAHWEYFPNVQIVTQSIVDELKDILMYSSIDDQTSDVSTSPYCEEMLSKMLNTVNQIRPLANAGKKQGYAACVIGRLMNVFYHVKFLNFHGQHGARLSRDQTVHEPTHHNSSLLMAILSPLLFYAPDAHFKSLEKMYVDRLVTLKPWKDFIDKLNGEWTEFTLYGTVILNANVAFLAIQSVDNASVGGRSPAQIASYLSLVTSAGAVILGLLLVRQNRTKPRESPEHAAAFLDKMYHRDRGLTFLAVMYSLPYALLMWGTLSFLAAFSSMCLLHTNTMTMAFVGVAWFLVVLLILVCIYVAWEGGEHYLLNWVWRKSAELGSAIANFRKEPLNQDSDDAAGAHVQECWRWPFLREISRDSTTLTNNSVTAQV